MIRSHEPPVTQEPKLIRVINNLPDDYFIAVSKSRNLLFTPPGYFSETRLSCFLRLIWAYLHRFTGLTARHRVCILFGSSAEAASLVQRGFDNFNRSYLAVVNGIPGETEFAVDMPIGPARRSDKEKSVRRIRTEEHSHHSGLFHPRPAIPLWRQFRSPGGCTR